MGSFDLHSRVLLSDPALDYTYPASMALLGVLGVLSLCIASFRGMLTGSGKSYVDWVVHWLLAASALAIYGHLTEVLMNASEDLVGFFAAVADVDNYLAVVTEELKPLFESQESSRWDRLLGFLRGGAMTVAVSGSYFLEFLVFQLIQELTSVFAAILYVMGPVMIACSVITQGHTLRQWFGALLQVLLWPVVPPFLMLIVLGTAGNAVQSGNLVFILTQNLILAVLGLLTPAVVAFLVGKGGFTVAAVAAAGLGAKALGQGTDFIRMRARGASGSGGPGPNARFGAGGGGSSPASRPTETPSSGASRRPGDDVVSPGYRAQQAPQTGARGAGARRGAESRAESNLDGERKIRKNHRPADYSQRVPRSPHKNAARQHKRGR